MQTLKITQNNNQEWQSERVGNLTLHPQYGWTTSAKRGEQGLKLLRTTDISNGTINWDTVPACLNEPPQIDKYLLKSGDILVSRAGSVGLSCYIEDPPSAVFASYLIRFRAREDKIKSKYLYYFFQSEKYWDFIGAGKAGIAIPNVNATKLADIEVDYPISLTEQDKIIKKLDVLLPQIKTGAQQIMRAKKVLNKFRQAILFAAVTGKLTEKWRAQNETLSKISLPNNTFNGYDDLPDIPDTWTWAVLGDVTNIRGGVTKGRDLGNKKVVSLPYLRVANVQDGFLDLSEIKEIEIPIEEVEKYLLQVGDILFTEGGDRDKLGRGAIWNGEIEKCIHQNHIFRARVSSNEVTPDFITLATKSNYAKDYFFLNASQTVNLASINLTTLKNTPIALPPLEEQKEIIQRVKQYFDIADAVTKQISKAEKGVGKLTQAVLAKIFEQE